jgi:hypothetical protein
MSTEIKDRFTNLLEPFEAVGQWWIPGAQDKQYNGVLTYKPQESILELKLIGNILPIENGPMQMYQHIKIINGLTVGGQYITLLNCLYFIDSMRFPGYISTKVTPQFVFVGWCFEQEQEIVFNEAIYSCYNLENVIGESGFKTELKLGDNNSILKYTLSYEYPTPIAFKFDKYSVSLNWAVNLPFTGPEINANETVGFTIKTQEYYKHTDFIQNPILSIHQFIQLITEQNLPIRNVFMMSDKIGEKREDGSFRSEPISLIWRNTIDDSLPKKRHSKEYFFTLHELKEEINSIMPKWHDVRSKYKPAYNLYFTVFRMRRDLNLENRFLNLCHVLEVYHRIKSSDTYMAPEEYQILLDQIIKSVPDGHKKHIQQRLHYGNEISLRQRLKQIYDYLPNKIQSRVGEKKKFCDDVVNTRNYLTHYDENLKLVSLKVDGMMKYECILLAICKVLLLMEAGISPEILNEKMANFYITEVFNYER